MRERNGIMLAHAMTPGKLHGYSKCFLQPKLNGERCKVEWFHGEPVLVSSTGLEFPYLDHIKQALLEYDRKVWDGELYTHGMPREEIASIANRKKNRHPDEEKLQYHIFDHVDFHRPQAERIVNIGMEGFNGEVIHLVPTYIVQLEDIVSYTNMYLGLGYEGIILRHPLGIYETKRTNAMLKHKPTEVDYYIIVEVIEAVSESGEKKNMAGAFRVLSPGHDVFKVSAGKLTHDERKFIFQNRDYHKGRLLKVKHEKIKTDVRGIPVSCVAISIVDKEGD